jgi:hypothetical protein
MDLNMTITEERDLFVQVCTEQMRFLETDFGCRIVDIGVGEKDHEYGNGTFEVDIRMVYENSTTTVTLFTGGHGSELSCAIGRRLPADGPADTVGGSSHGIDVLTTLRRMDLVFRSSLRIPDHLRQPKPGQSKAEVLQAMVDWKRTAFEASLSQYAVILRNCGVDVLLGDFTVFDKWDKLGWKEREDLSNKLRYTLVRKENPKQYANMLDRIPIAQRPD